MQVALPSLRVLRKSSTAEAVGRSVTTMLSSLEQQVVMISSCYLLTYPRSPRRPRTPGKPCCIISRNILPICPCYSFCDKCSRRSLSNFRIYPRSSSLCLLRSKTRSCFSLMIFSAIVRAFSIFSRTSVLAAVLDWYSFNFTSRSPLPNFALPRASRTLSNLLFKFPASRLCRESST